jgi:hypothetical protein
MLIASGRVQKSRELNNLEILNEFFIQVATLHVSIFDMCSIDQ